VKFGQNLPQKTFINYNQINKDSKYVNANYPYHEYISQARPQKLVPQMQPIVKLVGRTDNCIDQLQASRLHN